MHRLPLSVLAAATVAAAACQQEQPANVANADEPVMNLPAVPPPVPTLDRTALLAAVAEAASAAAAGTPPPESLRNLDGRQFELRIRFGCRGPVTNLEQRWLGWSFDAEKRRIRVRAMPTISGDDPLVEQIGDDEFEAVEGFWVPRPWLLQAVCPASAAVQANVAAGAGQPQTEQRPAADSPEPIEEAEASAVSAGPKIGIAQFFTRNEPRSRRRDMRPYQAAHSLAEGEALSSQGYDLVLSGRLRALPGRGVIHCTAGGPDVPPDCIVSAEFQRVWIEQPDNREVIAEWGTG
jgi:hypothetical protein